eukprot:3134440-Alexandrium_andersonii.AAC.1
MAHPKASQQLCNTATSTRTCQRRVPNPGRGAEASSCCCPKVARRRLEPEWKWAGGRCLACAWVRRHA